MDVSSVSQVTVEKFYLRLLTVDFIVYVCVWRRGEEHMTAVGKPAQGKDGVSMPLRHTREYGIRDPYFP